ncbi:MAG: TolC family protein [Planctomycetes bacterium]|nr:TolC family protein [Planctomycetota bacterium]
MSDEGGPFEGRKELTGQALVDEVLARNPTLAQMSAAWQAALERIPQAKSWDDPMFIGGLAPASFGSRNIESAYRVELSQKFYYPGKLRLKGQTARAEANASRNDLEDVRLQLIEAARLAFFEYYLTDRALNVNQEALRLLTEFRQNADARFKAGQVPQQDLFQADVEIGRQKERQVILERMQKIAKARNNTLMHRPSTTPLPLPAQAAPQWMALPDVETLQAKAVRSRPDLQALANRVSAEEAASALARREFYPDVSVAGAYDTFMGNGPARDMAAQIAVRIDLPVRLARRHAAVNESLFKIAQKRAELASRTDQVNYQVQEAYEQLLESEKILQLYDRSILPAAKANIGAAQDAYRTGKVPFLSLIEAQRNYVNLKDRYFEATADFFRRRANLNRATGASVAGPAPMTKE